MEDNLERFAVFCTADIPIAVSGLVLSTSNLPHFTSNLETISLQTLESFLVKSEKCYYDLCTWDDEEVDLSEHFVLMTSKDLSTIRDGMSSPVQPFASPFIGDTIQEMVAWFQENISEPEVQGYHSSGFIVFDSESLEEEVCTIVSFNIYEEETNKLYETVRCDFTIAITITTCLSVGKDFDDIGARCFGNSGVLMTKERSKIVSDGGMYLDGMEVKYDEFWRDFIKKWSS